MIQVIQLHNLDIVFMKNSYRLLLLYTVRHKYL